MARVLIETQGWMPVDTAVGNSRFILISEPVTIKNTDGTAATHWSAQTGGTSSTADQSTDSRGVIVGRWLEEGQYDVTVRGSTRRVETVSGSRVSRGTDPGPNTGSIDAAIIRAINPVLLTDNTSTVYHYSVGDGTKYQHLNGQGVGVVGGLYFAVEDSTAINGSLQMTVNQTGQNDGTVRASSTTGKTPGLYLRSISHIRMQPGLLADNVTFDSSSFVLVQAPQGLAVQNTGGTLTYFAATPSGGGKIGFYGVTTVVQQNTTGTATGFTAGAGTAVTDQSTFTGASGSTAYRISDVVKALKAYGLLAA